MFKLVRDFNFDVLNWTEAFLNYDESVNRNENIKFKARTLITI